MDIHAVIQVCVSMNHHTRFIPLHQSAKRLKALMSRITVVSKLPCWRMRQQNIKAVMKPDTQHHPADTAVHLGLRMLMNSIPISHGAAQSENTHALMAINLIFNTDTSQRRCFLIAVIVISMHIEHRSARKGCNIRQIIRLQIAAG